MFKKRKKEEGKKENRLTCHLCNSIIILKTGFLLEWSFRCCLPPVWNPYQFRLLWQDRGQHSSLCGGKLLGLCPYPLLIVHPVLTETQKHRDKDILNPLNVLFSGWSHQCIKQWKNVKHLFLVLCYDLSLVSKGLWYLRIGVLPWQFTTLNRTYLKYRFGMQQGHTTNKSCTHFSLMGFSGFEQMILPNKTQFIQVSTKIQKHLPVNCISLCLCWVLNVRLIQQLLDPQQDLKTQ